VLQWSFPRIRRNTSLDLENALLDRDSQHLSVE
jgi:hypothetical protein